MVALAIGGAILLILGLTLLLRRSMDVVGDRFGRKVFRYHQDAEYIMETRLAPDSWHRELASSRRRRGASAMGAGLSGHVPRLSALIRYFRTAPVFDSEDTRIALLKELRAIREQWLADSDIGQQPGT
jgi:hypothetical protein